MIKVKLACVGILCAFGASLGTLACAEDSSAPVAAAVSDFIAQRFRSQSTTDDPMYPLVVAETVPALIEVSVNGVDVPVFTRTEARERQLAWFIYLAKVEQTENAVVVEYQTPFNASGGTASMERTEDGWKLTRNEKWRSSSGARAFYGELYEGVACRDDTEMARRQRSIGGMKDAPPKAKCSSKEFPEVAAYQQMKQLLKK